ncbi:MAG: zinc-ribbon domain-containing protein [Micrococcaceae bacterium]
MNYCGKCGAKLKSGNAFCQNCGAPISPVEDKQESEFIAAFKAEEEIASIKAENSNPKINKSLIAGGAAVLIIAAITGGVLTSGGTGKATPKVSASATATPSKSASLAIVTPKSESTQSATGTTVSLLSGYDNIYSGGGTYVSTSGYSVNVPKEMLLKVNNPNSLDFIDGPNTTPTYSLRLTPNANSVKESFDLTKSCPDESARDYGVGAFDILTNLGNPRNSPETAVAGSPDVSPRALLRYYQSEDGKTWKTDISISDHTMGYGGEYCTTDGNNKNPFVRTNIGELAFYADSSKVQSGDSQAVIKEVTAKEKTSLYPKYLEIAKTIKISK